RDPAAPVHDKPDGCLLPAAQDRGQLPVCTRDLVELITLEPRDLKMGFGEHERAPFSRAGIRNIRNKRIIRKGPPVARPAPMSFTVVYDANVPEPDASRP